MQTMSQAPFRLVDEINQGMDATNERNIFRQVCRTSCIMDEVVPQTFVISPKLLTNLEYTEGSTVHVVFSGLDVFCADEQNEHDPSLWNIRDFIERDSGLFSQFVEFLEPVFDVLEVLGCPKILLGEMNNERAGQFIFRTHSNTTYNGLFS